MFLVIVAVAPMILFLEVLQTNIAIAVVADALAVGFVISKDVTGSQAFRYSFTQILGGLSVFI
jgi:hypothetical protein